MSLGNAPNSFSVHSVPAFASPRLTVFAFAHCWFACTIFPSWRTCFVKFNAGQPSTRRKYNFTKCFSRKFVLATCVPKQRSSMLLIFFVGPRRRHCPTLKGAILKTSVKLYLRRAVRVLLVDIAVVQTSCLCVGHRSVVAGSFGFQMAGWWFGARTLQIDS